MTTLAVMVTGEVLKLWKTSLSRNAAQRTATGSYLALPPDQAKDIIEAVRRECVRPTDGAPVVLLTQADVRRFVRRLIEVELPDVVVLGYQELSPDATVQPLSRVGLGA